MRLARWLPVAVKDEQSPTTGERVIFFGRWPARLVVAWSLVVFALALLAGTVVFLTISAVTLTVGGSLLPAYIYLTNSTDIPLPFVFLYALDLLALVVFALIGALLIGRFPAQPIGWIVCAIGLIGIAEECATHYAVYSLIVRPGALPGGLLAAWFTEWSWTLFACLLNVWLPLLFPTGRLPSSRWRPVGWFALCACAALTLSFMLKPGPLGNRARLASVVSPVTLFPPNGPIGQIASLAFGAVLVCMLLAAVALIVRLRRARGDERQQLKWFCYPVALLAGLFIFQGIFQQTLHLWPTLLNVAYRLAWVSAFTLLPVAVGVAILRYRLYDIDLVINRTLVYGALSLTIGCAYLLVVGVLSALAHTQENIVISLIAACAVAALFEPLRSRLQRGINRLLYGERDEPYAVLTRLGQRLETSLAPDAVLPAIAQTVRDALKLPYVAIALRDDQDFVVAAATGEPVDKPLMLPLIYQNEQVAQMLLAPRAGEATLSGADERLLSDLARQAGVAAHAVQLTTDLQRSRERLVAAREEERRRLRRDLHDGLGPRWATHALKLEVARDLLASDPARADEMLSGLIGESRAALETIRGLAYALRPPALDELGLVGAISEQAAQYIHTGLRVTVESPEQTPPLPAAVEVATYRIAVEALTNVVKHAAARNCVITLRMDDGLWLEIRDDGCGLPADRRMGVGLTSMRERAAELGGTCEIASAEGAGVTVIAWLPAQRAADTSAQL